MFGMGASTWLCVAVIVLAGLALATLASAVRHGLRREFGRASFKSLTGCVGGLLAVVVLLVGINLLTWQRFSHETPVAELHFSRQGAQRFRVRLQLPDGKKQIFELRGDAWQLDARVLKWTSLATVLGLDPLYRMERIEGRYDDVQQARTAPRTVISLASSAGISLWQLARQQTGWLPFIDASYGSATYLPMADDATYRVTISRTGLLARPINDNANHAVQAWSTSP